MLHIRPAVATDAAAIAVLLHDLGYPATSGDVAQRLTAFRDWPDHGLFIGELDGETAGLCHIEGMRLIASDGYAEVMALVVAAKHRRKGIGSALLRHTVNWASAHGYTRVRLRSGEHREDAHKFYEAAGFKRAKTSIAFELVP